MEQLTAALAAVQVWVAAHPAQAEWYMALVRFVFPVLTVLILYRAVRSLLTIPHTPETWGQLSLPNGAPIPLTHWENLSGRGASADVRRN